MRWLIAALLCALSVPASADVQTNIGVLTCTLAEAGHKGETPPSQTRAMLCAFKPNGGAPEERYTGEIQKVGSRSALSDEAVLIWVVMGPDHRELAPGLLGQTYVGELAPAVDGEVRPPKMLVGKRDDAYALRPMSDSNSESATGSVTIVVLKVKSIPA
jgi:Protein of unknown function (DUF992)